jgi:hypothetical protein
MTMTIARQWLRTLAVVMSFGVISLGMILTSSSVAACSFIFPPWYTTTTTLQIPPLPTGVLLEEIPEDPSRSAPKKLRITNTTAIPLYIIATFPPGATDFEPIAHQFPDRRGPTDKVVAGVASQWTQSWDTDQDHWMWKQQSSAVTVYLTHEEITTGDGAIARFSNNVGPDRPINASPPVPERRTIPLVYGTQLVLFRDVVTRFITLVTAGFYASVFGRAAGCLPSRLARRDR